MEDICGVLEFKRLTGLFILFRAGGFTYSLTDERSAKLDLLEHGPFVALMVTCFDFMFYKKGGFFKTLGYYAQLWVP